MQSNSDSSVSIGIIGSGQLARMLALSGIPLGLSFSFLAEANENTSCVTTLGKIVRREPGQSAAELYEALGRPALITSEKEQVDMALLEALQQSAPVHPNVEAFRACHHRLLERQLLESVELDFSPYRFCASAADCAEQLGLPLIAKSCREGYDGKNQYRINNAEDIAHFDAVIANSDAFRDDYIIERCIPFDAEVSQVSARSLNGEIIHYPMAENQHHNGILCESIAPASCVDEAIGANAQRAITAIMEKLDYVGVMAMECFLVGDKLLVNELAPRVHNSGHWTQNGSQTSQFENHLRAITGLTLGSTEAHGIAAMLNLIGTEAPPQSQLGANATLHWYDKAARPGRKQGHINVAGDTVEELRLQLQDLGTRVGNIYSDS